MCAFVLHICKYCIHAWWLRIFLVQSKSKSLSPQEVPFSSKFRKGFKTHPEATECECSCHNTNTERCAGSICWCWKIENFTSPVPSCQVEVSSFAFVCPSPLRFLAAEIHAWMLLHRALQTGAARCLSMFKPAGTWKHPALPNCPLPRSPTSSLVDWLLLLTPPNNGPGEFVNFWHMSWCATSRNTWALVYHIGFGVSGFGCGMFMFLGTATWCLCYATHALWCITLGFGVSGGACSHSLSLQRHVHATQHMGSGVSHWGLAFRVGHVHILCHCNVTFMLRNTWALVFHIGVWRFGWGMFTFFVTATSCLCYATHGLWRFTLGFGVSGFRCGMFKFFVTATSCLCYATHGLWCFTLGFGVSGGACSHSLSLQRHVYSTQHMGSGVSHWGLAFRVGHVHILCHCNVMFMLRNTWALVFHIGVWRFGWGMFTFFVTATSRLCYATHGLWCFTLGFGVSGGECSHSLSLQRHVYATQHMGSGVSHWGLGFRASGVACSSSLSLQRHVYATQHMGSGVSHWGSGFPVLGAASSWSLSLQRDVCATQHMGSCVLHSCVSCIICIMEIISLTKIISSLQFGGGPYHFIEIKWGLWPPRYIYIYFSEARPP